MSRINRAWAILRDAATRRELDRRRQAAATGESSVPVPAWMQRHAATHRPAAGWGAGAAGPPPGRPSGSILDFGIYRDWSLGEVERRDAGYLDWLVDRPEGLPFRGEILAIQARRRPSAPKARRGLFGFG